MGIGASIFLLAVGAILTFALNVSIAGIDLDAVGWILMAAGALGLVITSIFWSNRRSRTTTVADEPAEYRRVEERSDVPPPPVR
ncbi:MAG: hypothetical protein HOV77_19650 [Hamadaea sp.]|uniref:DUF6458 family protein n=1 Tax=Hamadaea sp. TaxID=2024425 RepID=UPI00184FE43E|nr:DUF6458 family protein [Hamadaea sp.]NUT21395.1 hypothetical protein [Hamadaea sp.]